MIAVCDSSDHEALVQRHIASFASLATLDALRGAPLSRAAEIAASVGATLPETRAALDELQQGGLVEAVAAEGGTRYRLTTQPALRAAVEAVLERYASERHFRTRLVLDILRRMSPAGSRG